MAGTFEAAEAGPSDESSVIPIPTAADAKTVRGCMTTPDPGSVAPKAPRRARSPSASRMPPPTPAAEATSPTIAASDVTDRRI
jgi:hypothetical protein